MAVIIVIAIVVFGPDRLPEFARQAGRVLRQVRSFSQSARDDIRSELGFWADTRRAFGNGALSLFPLYGAAAFGLLFGVIAIRRQGIYFAMVTLALSQMVFFLALLAGFIATLINQASGASGSAPRRYSFTNVSCARSAASSGSPERRSRKRKSRWKCASKSAANASRNDDAGSRRAGSAASVMLTAVPRE